MHLMYYTPKFPGAGEYQGKENDPGLFVCSSYLQVFQYLLAQLHDKHFTIQPEQSTIYLKNQNKEALNKYEGR